MASIAIQSALLHETSQEFLLRTLTESSARLHNLFTKFIDDQIRAIEDTKVKIKKRKGVIAFMRIFPNFAISVENIYSGATRGAPTTPDLMEVRSMIDTAYDRINQAMWVSLKQIARESPTMGGQQGADPEDKEVLNYHILLIENMNHYIEEVDDGGKEDAVLTRWKGKALMERAEHLDEYVKRVVRRPLGKVLVSHILPNPYLVNHLLTHPRTSSNQQNPCSTTAHHRPRSPRNPRIPARQPAKHSPQPTAAKSAKASTRCASVSRSTLATPTTRR